MLHSDHAQFGRRSCKVSVTMDRPYYALQQTKSEILASKEWKRVVQDLCIFFAHRTEGGQVENYERLSQQEKYELMRKAARQLQRTSAFRDLQSKVAAVTTQTLVSIPSFAFLNTGNLQHHNDAPFNPAEHFQSDQLASVNAANACAHLLQEHCHLKHYLKKCFNHPLPAELRITAWKTLLQHPEHSVRRRNQHFNSFQAESKENKEITERCEVILSSSRFLTRSPIILKALKSVMAFCSHYKESRPSDTEFLLCIPFLFVWQNSLERENKADAVSGSIDKMKQSLSDIADTYLSFMENIPRIDVSLYTYIILLACYLITSVRD